MKLNIGSGDEPLEGYVNLDAYPVAGVNVIHDLNAGRLPFADDTFQEIRAFFVLEHVTDPIFLIEDIYRVGKHGCTVTIAVPYWNSVCYAKDITHKRGFHENNFYILDPRIKKRKHFYPRCVFSLKLLHLLVLENHYEIRNGMLVKGLLRVAPFIPNLVRDLVVTMTVDKQTAVS